MRDIFIPICHDPKDSKIVDGDCWRFCDRCEKWHRDWKRALCENCKSYTPSTGGRGVCAGDAANVSAYPSDTCSFFKGKFSG